jgi:hypothetical protein
MYKLAVNVGTLEKAWKKMSSGRVIKKDFADMPSGSELKKVVPNGKTNAIAITKGVPVPKNMANKFFMKGSVAKTVGGFLASKKKNVRMTGKSKKGLNSTINVHEGDEMKQLSKPNNPPTLAGQAYGHHSMAKILGPESNRMITAEGKGLKKGTKHLKKFREATKEKESFDHFALKAKDGSKPYKYGEGKRTSRAYREAMYRKELGLPKATKPEIAKLLGKKSKDERRTAHEQAVRINKARKAASPSG